MAFSELLGNTGLKQRLAASFRRGQISHCYLIYGPDGSGKTTLAGAMAAAMQCTGTTPPCGTCQACRKVLSGNHPDVITVDDPDKKSVSVELIRQVQADAYIRPNEGKRKVYVIPRAGEMTDSAQNALLKLMEEPPPYAVFLLLTPNAQRLLPTVRSRCAALRLEPVSKEETVAWLRQKFPKADPAAMEAAWLRAGGYPGQAAVLMEEGGQLPQTAAFAAAYESRDPLALVQLLAAMERKSRAELREILQQWYRLLYDAMMTRAGIPCSAEAAAISRSRTGTELNASLQILRQAIADCDANLGTGHLCGWLSIALR